MTTDTTYIAHGTDQDGNLYVYRFETFNEAYDFQQAVAADDKLKDNMTFEVLIHGYTDTVASALAEVRELMGVEA
ncbi:hypothetical protein UFOVP33_48 [uncultured Caudovirales phage]|uniref:Uncharacterized protein n=1 Tax=uncultured Caudovirales phage TaxID=2100421 RepID=A0A6J5KR73_9CAUD|nr:hypothetical protein UFOVP33_48 [uncultured Caudovirales phage]